MKFNTAAITGSSINTIDTQSVAGSVFTNRHKLELLTESAKPEVIKFLAVRPVHTVVMISFIEDNGIESADNRGKFYGFRSRSGKLEGVALIGHTTLIESRSANALSAFASIARLSETPVHIVMSDNETVEAFWKNYADADQTPRLTCSELLFELNFPFMTQLCKWNVRPAKAAELEKIAHAHAEVAFTESGVDPLLKDRAGFLKRTLRRIEQNRTFVVFQADKLVFKADIVAETTDVIYLEGIYVAPEFRGQGIAAACLSKLGAELLKRVENICLLSNTEMKAAHRSFIKAGFKNTDCSKTVFV